MRSSGQDPDRAARRKSRNRVLAMTRGRRLCNRLSASVESRVGHTDLHRGNPVRQDASTAGNHSAGSRPLSGTAPESMRIAPIRISGPVSISRDGWPGS